MKRISFIMLFITMCVMVNAQSGEEMLRRAISTNPTNSWGNAKQKGQWTTGSNMGAYLYASGSMYLGDFFGTENHGYGITIASEGRAINDCPNAKYHVGYWSHEKKSGKGTCYDASGTLIYYGEFKDDKPTGTYPTTGSYSAYKFQTIDHTNGDKYIGETYNGKRHGYGVYAWKDGRIWIGNWKDGIRAGSGIDIASNGSLTVGSWDNDTYSSGSTVASNSSSSSGSSGGGSYGSAPAQQYDPESDFKVTRLSDGTAQITEYIGTKTAIRIPPRIQGMPVTKIGDKAFTKEEENSPFAAFFGGTMTVGKGITSVVIPDSVTAIGAYAFYSNRLTSVTIPNSVTAIGNFAFASNQLTSVAIPSGVTVIGRSVFSNNKLTNVTIPNSVTAIGDAAFVNNQLTSVTIPASVTSIGDAAFRGNKLTSITIPNRVTRIGIYTFGENQLTSVTIPSGVTAIGNHAFRTNRLASVTIPASVTSIGEAAFAENRLTSITIGAKVRLISGGYNFDNSFYDDDDDDYYVDEHKYESSFENGFVGFYDEQGKRAGTYTLSNNRWNAQYR